MITLTLFGSARISLTAEELLKAVTFMNLTWTNRVYPMFRKIGLKSIRKTEISIHDDIKMQPHFHLLVQGIEAKNRIVTKLSKFGFIDCSPIDQCDLEKVIYYLCKPFTMITPHTLPLSSDYARSLHIIYSSMRGKRMINKTGFKLKESNWHKTASYYEEYKFDYSTNKFKKICI